MFIYPLRACLSPLFPLLFVEHKVRDILFHFGLSFTIFSVAVQPFCSVYGFSPSTILLQPPFFFSLRYTCQSILMLSVLCLLRMWLIYFHLFSLISFFEVASSALSIHTQEKYILFSEFSRKWSWVRGCTSSLHSFERTHNYQGIRLIRKPIP